MSPIVGSTSNTLVAASQIHAVAAVQASTPLQTAAPSTADLLASAPESGSASPGLNSLSDQPLSPQVMNELMHIYASIHG